MLVAVFEHFLSFVTSKMYTVTCTDHVEKVKDSPILSKRGLKSKVMLNIIEGFYIIFKL